LPARMKEVLMEAQRAAESNSLEWAALARGIGVIYLVLLPRARDEQSRARVAIVTNDILAVAARLGGHGTIPWAPSEWKSALKIWGLERGDFAQMQNVKKVFDPHGIMAPGRFAGRL